MKHTSSTCTNRQILSGSTQALTRRDAEAKIRQLYQSCSRSKGVMLDEGLHALRLAQQLGVQNLVAESQVAVGTAYALRAGYRQSFHYLSSVQQHYNANPAEDNTALTTKPTVTCTVHSA